MSAFGAIMAGLGTAASLAGNIVNGVMSTRNNRKLQKESDDYFNNAESKVESGYNSQIYQDPMRRADNVSILSQADRRMKSADDVAAARQKITGGTNEARLAQRGRFADSYASLMSNIAGQASRRVDALTQARNNAILGLDAKRHQSNMGLLDRRNQTYANLAANATQLAGNALYGLGRIGDGAGKTSTPTDEERFNELQGIIDQGGAWTIPQTMEADALRGKGFRFNSRTGTVTG